MESPAERFFRATPRDINSIASLVNSAYRGDSSRRGWTTEADMLGGQRTDPEEISSLVFAPDSMFLLCADQEGLLGTIHIEYTAETSHLGMFAVRPSMQGRGTGKRLLREAEKISVELGARRAEMAVLTFRYELICFYERLGYSRTGRFRNFPDDPRFGLPKVNGLRFEFLEKFLSAG